MYTWLTTTLFVYAHIYFSSLYIGLDELKSALQLDLKSERMCKLCVSDDSGHLIFPCFSVALPVTPMVESFFLLKQKHPTDIFEQIWSTCLKAAWSEKTLRTLADIVPRVWEPTFSVCEGLLESLKNQTIQLSDVDKYFSHYRGDIKALSIQLRTLYTGICACRRQSPKDLQWMKDAVDSMKNYWSLSRYCAAAGTLLRLKDKLCLTGDFTDVERLAHKVSVFNDCMYFSDCVVRI